jgi:hypothetical protein
MTLELTKELDFFKRNKDKWLKIYRDKYVLVKGEELVGTFDNTDDAYQAAVQKFGNTPVLIKQVTTEEKTEEIPALALGIIRASL